MSASTSAPGSEGRLTFRTWLAGRPPDESALEAYVRSIGAEWWTSDWKASEEQVGFGVRKTVAAIANGRGGELFVGVRNDRSIPGTTATLQQLEQELRQALAQPGSWYVVSLLRPTRYVTEVELSTPRPGRRAFVLEVQPLGLPSFVREDDGSLSLYLRSGGSSIRVGGFEAMEWSRETSRERLLLGIFREFQTMVRQVRIAVGYDIRVTAGIQPRLPYLVRALQDGSFYELLSDDDIKAVMGQRTTNQSGDTGGFLSRFLDLEDKVWRIRERQSRNDAAYNVEAMTIQELSSAHLQLEQDVEAFRLWLVNQRLLPA
jgi:DNA-dependent RNA polymerase auxiliary subunit epsilon